MLVIGLCLALRTINNGLGLIGQGVLALALLVLALANVDVFEM